MDNNQYNNDGNIIQPTLEAEQHESNNTKRRIKWIPLAMIFILIGGLMFGFAWISGARGGQIYWQNRRLHVETQNSARGRNNVAENRITGENFGLFHTIDIRTVSSSVTVVTHMEPYISFSGGNITASENDGVLTLSDTARASGRRNLMSFGFTNRSYPIRVYVPASFESGTVNIRTTSGSVTVSDIHPSRLTINTISGSIDVRNIGVAVEYMNLRATSGRVRVKNVQYVSEFHVQTVSGSIGIDTAEWSHLNANATSGRITIDNGLPWGSVHLRTISGSVGASFNRDLNDFDIELRTTSGSMRVDGTRVSGRLFTRSQAVGDILMDVRTTSGSIRLDFN